MDEAMAAVARACMAGALDGRMSFPAIVATLSGAGFEGYAVDFRRGAATCHAAAGGAADFPQPEAAGPLAAVFDADALCAAIRSAQGNTPGYTYRGFLEQARAAGCAGYVVSFPGRRALYFGRHGETHVEDFPPAP